MCGDENPKPSTENNMITKEDKGEGFGEEVVAIRQDSNMIKEDGEDMDMGELDLDYIKKE